MWLDCEEDPFCPKKAITQKQHRKTHLSVPINNSLNTETYSVKVVSLLEHSHVIF